MKYWNKEQTVINGWRQCTEKLALPNNQAEILYSSKEFTLPAHLFFPNKCIYEKNKGTLKWIQLRCNDFDVRGFILPTAQTSVKLLRNRVRQSKINRK